MKKLKLICMSFDGDYKTEAHGETVSELWEHSNDLGSKCFFYPFHFVCTDKSIKDAGPLLQFLNGKRITTVQKMFKTHSENPETEGLDSFEFAFFLNTKEFLTN